MQMNLLDDEAPALARGVRVEVARRTFGAITVEVSTARRPGALGAGAGR